MPNRRGAVLHPGVGGRVVLNAVHVQEHRLLPEVVSLAGVDQLWDIHLCSVHLDEVHELLGFVLGEAGAESVYMPLCAIAMPRPLSWSVMSSSKFPDLSW